MAQSGLPSPVARLDDHEVEPDRQSRDGATVRQGPAIEQSVRRLPDTSPLSMIDRLLCEPEATRASPANLDDHEGRRWTRVDRHEIEFVTADMDVPGQDGPTGLDQSVQDQRLGGVTRQLGRGPVRIGRWHIHEDRLADDPHRARIGDFTAALRVP
jgi:hypothetical protein